MLSTNVAITTAETILLSIVLIMIQPVHAQSVTQTEAKVYDTNGTLLDRISAGQQVVLSIEFSNVRDIAVPYVAILEVRQSDGFTVYLAWQNSTILANDHKVVGVSWIATDTGEYHIRTVAFSPIENVFDIVSESQISVV